MKTITQKLTRTEDLDRYAAAEDRQDRDDLAGLSRRERAEMLRQLYCVAHPIAWRSLQPAGDGRLHGLCPTCGAHIDRSTFAS